MPSDRARLSLDPTRQYSGVVRQQGRVTLEADENEASAIAAELLRAETRDIVGPTGTPDDGYDVTTAGVAGAAYDLQVAGGTMYVGGVRVTRQTGTYAEQARTDGATDWRDYSSDGMWVDPDKPTEPANELVYLFLREQEVSATEDTALRDVALGGPDSAQRLRLLQRIVRLGTDASDCDGARETLTGYWRDRGLDFRYAEDMRLVSDGRLVVGLDDDGAASDPCEPDAHGGYLGADNQLIRVQISGPGTIVWGFDNASFLYRVNVIDPAGVVELQSAPVDTFHHPRALQAVELLRTAATLDADDFIAADTGMVQTLGVGPYNPDNRRVTLPAAIPAPYIPVDATPALFLRVWEQELAFQPGAPVTLGTTGLNVTLTSVSGVTFHVGDYWMFAARPATATQLYPQRYLEAPQPPEGPRLWANPLAVVVVSEEDRRVEDCRDKFDDLVELTKRRDDCCTVSVGDGRTSRGTYQRLQDAIEAIERVRGGGCVRILPGYHVLDGPVVIRGTDICICGCCDAIVESRDGPAFVLYEAARVSIDSLKIVGADRRGVVLVYGSEDIGISGCEIDNRASQGQEGGFVNEPAPAISAISRSDQGVTRSLVIEDCQLRGFPAAALQVQELRVRRNRLERGGIWLAEGTEDVRIEANEIRDGGSCGILMGGSPDEAGRPRGRFGIVGVTIRDNLIQGMSGGGIATSDRGVQGLATELPRSYIFDLDIERNRILDCVFDQDVNDAQDALGGIVVRDAVAVRIAGNRIDGNGRGQMPACGVFAERCLGVQISDNQIRGNGVTESFELDHRLYQGGIIIPSVLRTSFTGFLAAMERPQILRDGAAAIIHDNDVSTPSGHALIVRALGSVSVADNQLSAGGVWRQPLEDASSTHCVYILDLGQMPVQAYTASLFGAATVYHYEAAPAASANLQSDSGPNLLAGGRVLLHGNQITLSSEARLPNPLGHAAVVAMSFDDVSIQDNQTQLMVPAMGFDVAALAYTARAADNRFTELPLRTLVSCLSWGLLGSATSNQATHCILVGGISRIDQQNQVMLPTYCRFFEGFSLV